MSASNEKFKEYYDEDGTPIVSADQFKSNFVDYLHKFSSVNAVVNNEHMSKGEKQCWTALQEYEKGKQGDESAPACVPENVTDSVAKDPFYASKVLNEALIDDFYEPDIFVTPLHRNDVGFAKQVLETEGYSVTMLQKKAQEIVDKRNGKTTEDNQNENENQQEGEMDAETKEDGKQEGKEGKQNGQRGVVGVIVKVGDKAPNNKESDVFHDKGDAVARKAYSAPEQAQDEQEFASQAEVEASEDEVVNHGVQITEEELNAEGYTQEEAPLETTNFRDQGGNELEMGPDELEQQEGRVLGRDE